VCVSEKERGYLLAEVNKPDDVSFLLSYLKKGSRGARNESGVGDLFGGPSWAACSWSFTSREKSCYHSCHRDIRTGEFGISGKEEGSDYYFYYIRDPLAEEERNGCYGFTSSIRSREVTKDNGDYRLGHWSTQQGHQ
jgi:hypothetical protein